MVNLHVPLSRSQKIYLFNFFKPFNQNAYLSRFLYILKKMKWFDFQKIIYFLKRDHEHLLYFWNDKNGAYSFISWRQKIIPHS